jgi:hypothetical protein
MLMVLFARKPAPLKGWRFRGICAMRGMKRHETQHISSQAQVKYMGSNRDGTTDYTDFADCLNRRAAVFEIKSFLVAMTFCSLALS